MRPWKVAAIAAGPPDKVWQTRRAIKEIYQDWQGHYWYGKPQGYHLQFNDFTLAEIAKHALYHVGEVVYIKEAWHYLNIEENKATPYDFGIEYSNGEIRWWTDNAEEMNYPLDEKKRSPMFMPAWAARYFIKILTVEACRTRDISFEDCLAEGIVSIISVGETYYSWSGTPLAFSSPQAAYFALWEDINGKGSLSSNPWVWCYQFVKTARPEVGK